MDVVTRPYEFELFVAEEGNYFDQVRDLERLREALLLEISPDTELLIRKNAGTVKPYPSLIATFSEMTAPDIADLILTLETLACEKAEELRIE